MKKDREYQNWKREQEKEKILELISGMATIDVGQIALNLDKPIEEIKTLVNELVDEQLVASGVGGYYHLTFEGEELVSFRKAKASRVQQK